MENKFDKEKFSKILNRIYNTYSNQRAFATAMGISRGYLSQYINQKLQNPPTPKVLEKIANASQGITTYDDLMYMCGYTDTAPFGYDIVDRAIAVLPLFISSNGILEQYTDLCISKNLLKPNCTYFGYKSSDDTMSPLLGIGDIAIIEKIDKYENGNTCLISIDDTTIFIRKILDFKDYIELHTFIPYYQPIKLTKEEIIKRNFKILGKVIKVENESAFK